jgi:hypothetical protein
LSGVADNFTGSRRARKVKWRFGFFEEEVAEAEYER